MAENMNTNGSPLPAPDPQPIVPSKNSKRSKQHTKYNHHVAPQVDGTVSDSVTNPMASPRSRKGYKQRQQSVAATTIPNENMYAGGMTRPVSVGGGMLPATPAKEQAYAGPTFQASPAPSSLPVPKFFSRSVPNVAAQQQSLGARMAGERTPETDQSSPESDAVMPARQTQSPLDMFFKADRAEKQRSASMQSPEMYARRAVPVTEPRNLFQQQSRNAFLRELDGGGEMLNPKNVAPGQPLPPQRVHSVNSSTPPLQSDADREAATKSLKNLLFNIDATPPNPTPPRANSNPRNGNSPYSTPSPYQRASSGPSTPTPSADQQYNYDLHYGNRNLSPLFKSVRNDTPPSRPSGLRQQELASDVPNKSGPFPPPPQSQLQQIDADSFSRSYLHEQIRANQPPTMPSMRLTHDTFSHSDSSALPLSGAGIQPGMSGNGSSASPRTGSANANPGQQGNINFEDDLRRMLKLNV